MHRRVKADAVDAHLARMVYAEHELEVTTWAGLRETRGQRRRVSWADLLRGLHACLSRPHTGRGWSPATYVDDRRRRANLERAWMLGLDLDQVADMDAVCRLLERWHGLAHTTRSHTPAAPRARAMLTLSRPVSAEEYRLCWLAVADVLSRRLGQRVDPQAGDASRLWYLPSVPADGPGWCVELPGQALRVEPAIERGRALDARPVPQSHRPPPRGEMADRARRYLEQVEPSVSGSGGHAQAMWAALVAVRGFNLPPRVALDVLADWNARCVPPWSERELRRKVLQAEEAGHREWGFLLR